MTGGPAPDASVAETLASLRQSLPGCTDALLVDREGALVLAADSARPRPREWQDAVALRAVALLAEGTSGEGPDADMGADLGPGGLRLYLGGPGADTICLCGSAALDPAAAARAGRAALERVAGVAAQAGAA